VLLSFLNDHNTFHVQPCPAFPRGTVLVPPKAKDAKILLDTESGELLVEGIDLPLTGFLSSRGVLFRNPLLGERRGAEHLCATLDLASLTGSRILPGSRIASNFLYLELEEGTLELGHHRQCCESVELLDVCGDVADLAGAVIGEIACREDTYRNAWYEVATTKGDLTLRWGSTTSQTYGVNIGWTLFPRES
jgi:hypothetical protein